MKFIVDDMFGNVARWLRSLGYDAIYAGTFSSNIKEEKKISEEELIEKCLNEHRILVTRDIKLITSLETQFFKKMEENPKEYEKFEMSISNEYGIISPCIFLRETDTLDIMKRIYQEFHINLTYDTDKSRCSKCNTKIIKIIRKEDYKHLIPEGVYNYQKDFWICPNKDCEQLYWKGIQVKNFAERIKKLKTHQLSS
ncbi:MAG: hypothetical protein JXA99_17445 [Candidatus Lokiarchaeota archaeon]|nr:hypothetical protein [Candidatus Lokiarchaeota archaeon]